MNGRHIRGGSGRSRTIRRCLMAGDSAHDVRSSRGRRDSSAVTSCGASSTTAGRSTRSSVIPLRRSAAGRRSHPIPEPIDDLIALVDDLQPEVCFHLATAFRGVHVPADIEPMVTANVGFGTALAEAVSQAGDCTFVNTGTVWQHYDARPYSPVSLYAAMKQAFTDVLRFYQEVAGLPVVTLELTDTYGPGDPRPKLLPILLRAACEGTQLQMTDGTQLIDLLHVDDAVSALLATADGTPGETYGASGGETLNLRDLVARFESVSGLRSTPSGVSAPRDRGR